MKKIFLLVIVVINFSCRKYVAVDTPPDRIVTGQVFAKDATATSAVIDIYISFTQNISYFKIGNGGMTFYPALSADELVSYSNDPFEDEFQNNEISIQNSTNRDYLWTNAYQLIFKSNQCIEGLSDSKTLSIAVKNHLLGEALFLRSLLYFDLANLYGNCPLVLETDYNKTALLPSSNRQTIFQAIIKDLIAARDLMEDEYISAGKARPNKFAATALLAKVYLYAGDYTNAELSATSVITANGSRYRLSGDLNNVFLTNSDEAILQFVSVNEGIKTTEGQLFIPVSTSSVPQYTITDQLYNAFESGDQRKAKWIDGYNVGGTDYHYPFKYKLVYDGNPDPAESLTLLRLGEQYLIRAEARAQLNNVSGSKSDLDIVRARAGLSPSTANNKSTLLDAILKERRVELFCESGNRWMDLRRSGKINSVLSAVKPGWQPYDTIYPIPLLQIQRNPNLIQNPGYPR